MVIDVQGRQEIRHVNGEKMPKKRQSFSAKNALKIAGTSLKMHVFPENQCMSCTKQL